MVDREANQSGGHDAPERPRIEVECLSCGRRGSLDEADGRLAGTPLVTLTRRLRCSACGSRAVKARTVQRPGDLARRLRARMDARRPDE